MENKTTKNFIITEHKSGAVIVQTKRYDWKMEFSAESSHGQVLKIFIENETDEKINELLTHIYVTSASMLVDKGLLSHIVEYWDDKIKDAEIVQEVSEEDDAKNLKIVKDDTKAASNN